MGTPHAHARVTLIAGLLADSPGRLRATGGALCECFGALDLASDPAVWRESRYYAAEMGPELWRQFVSFAQPISPDTLWEIKLRTNALERRWIEGGGRRVNIDPGYLDANKVVLASTKNAAHRLALPGGIFGEATLYFAHGCFRPYPYTYRDYAAPEAVRFFGAVRERARKGR